MRPSLRNRRTKCRCFVPAEEPRQRCFELEEISHPLVRLPKPEAYFRVDFDVALTVLANGCYRRLAKRLRGFDKAAPKPLFRRFVETAGVVKIEADRIVPRIEFRTQGNEIRVFLAAGPTD